MKTLISCSLAGLALLVNTAYAGGGLEGVGVPSNMDFYGGASAGMASTDGACNAVIDATSCEDTSTGYKAFGGVRVSPTTQQDTLPTLGLEAGYISFGESSADGVLMSPRNIPIGVTKATSETSGVYVSGVGYMPVAPRTELIGKAGFMYWNQDGKVESPDDPTQNTSSSESGFGTILGAGAQYKVTDNLSIRGEYEQAFGVGKDNSEEEPSLLSVGAVFSTL